MKQTLQDMKVTYDGPIPIICENKSFISISKNIILHSKNKHIPIKYHFLREHVVDQVVRLEYISTKEQVVDIFTNPLAREPFKHLR